MKPDLRKFIRKSVVLLLPFIMMIVLAEVFIGRSVFMEASSVFCKVSNFLKTADEVKILVMGSSHADNAISASFSPHVFNMANPGQDFKHDLFLLDFLGDLHGIETVVFTVSYFSFEYSEEKEWPFHAKDYLDVETLKPERSILHFKKWLYDRSILLNYNLSPYQILKYYLKKIETRGSSGRAKRKKNGKADAVLDECESNLRKDAERRAVPLQARYHNAPAQEIERLFNEMLAICRKQKKMVFLVALPFSKAYNSGVGNNWITKFDRMLKYYQRKNDLLVLDYSRDSRFENDCALFLNADHLNRKGAEKFTKALLEDINKLNGHRDIKGERI